MFLFRVKIRQKSRTCFINMKPVIKFKSFYVKFHPHIMQFFSDFLDELGQSYWWSRFLLIIILFCILFGTFNLLSLFIKIISSQILRIYHNNIPNILNRILKNFDTDPFRFVLLIPTFVFIILEIWTCFLPMVHKYHYDK
jgi:hypothetical protein